MMTSEAAQALDWRERTNYDYLDFLAKRDWSWEGIRRNGDFFSDCRASSGSFECIERSDFVTVVRCHRSETALDRWGLIYSDMPWLNACDARVIWRPDRFAGVLSMTAMAAEAKTDARYFSLRAMRCPSLLILRPDDRQHVVFLQDGCGLQLAVHGESVLKPVRLMIDAAPGGRAAHNQMGLLKCFTDLGVTGRMKPQYGLKKIAARRLKMVLQALDGSIAGASHREIAVAIYGQNRVDADWNDPRENLKDHIRKTVRRGFLLMDGGYRSFLR
jgi:hypothetical protein